MIRVVGDQSKLPMPTVDWEGKPPEALAKALAPGSPFRKNMEWFEVHAAEIFKRHPGAYYCVACQELFVGSTRNEAKAAALAKYPDERGMLYAPSLPRWKG